MMDGLASGQADGRGHDVGGMLPPTGRAVGGALKVTQSNNGMHPTAGTLLVMLRRGAAAAGDAGR
jgi:hypothetical protein